MIEALGWVGSALVVTSLVQSDVRRLRQVNLASALVLGAFNVIVGITPMIVLKVVLATVNSYYLIDRPQERRDNRDDLAVDEPDVAPLGHY